MSDLRAAAQQALEALEKPNAGLVPHNGEWMSIQSVAITALRAALAEPERKPLTDEQIDRLTDQQWGDSNHSLVYAAHRAYARAIERAHGVGGDA